VLITQVGWSVEGLLRMERHGRMHLPSLFTIQLEQYEAAGADCLQQVIHLSMVFEHTYFILFYSV